MKFHRFIPWIILASVWPNPGQATAAVDFDRDIRPIFQERCFVCHGSDKQRGDLRLDRKSALLQGGGSGPALVVGKAKESLLVRRIRISMTDEQMPPQGQRLSEQQVRLIERWIDEGATWNDSTQIDAFKTHWAFQPSIRPQIPTPPIKGWGVNPVDAFIADSLVKKNLRPQPEVDRPTLLRRLKFDLLGLPPTPQELDAFVSDNSPDAYEKWVNRFLDSPQFGERWARHWLDLVRFAESHGFEMNQARPNSWPYRDYVIRAINEDKPYDRFILDQLAGDAGGDPVGTGFLVAGAFDQVKGDPLLNQQQRADEYHDMISTTGAAFLGLTVGCARCHNHKFDPVSQVDYYALKAVFAGVQHGERSLEKPVNERMDRTIQEIDTQLQDLRARLIRFEPLAQVKSDRHDRSAVNPRQNVDRFTPVEARFLRFTILETQGGSEPCIDELEIFSSEEKPRNVALAATGARATASGTIPGYPIHQLPFVNDGKYGNSRSWIASTPGRGWVQIELPQVTRIDTVIWSRDRNPSGFQDRLANRYQIEVAIKPGEWQLVASSDDRRANNHTPVGVSPGLDDIQRQQYELLSRQIQDLVARRTQLDTPAPFYGGQFVTPPAIQRLHRGEITQPREPVAPASPSAFTPRMVLSEKASEQERRVALAKWITDPRNPLTARVIVNRLWQYHFGTGIVATPSDFGINGARPTHPELLDYLASELIASGWSLKHIHRLIVQSATYRQGSKQDVAAMGIDASDRLLWRYPPRRLEAEAIRDSILMVSGKLDLRMGGPGFDLFEPNSNYVKLYIPKKSFGPAEWRRMVYQSKPRMRVDDIFGAFDCPDAGQPTPRRTISTTPLQVFNLLNSPFLNQQADFFAQRLKQEAGPEIAEQIRHGFRLAFQRLPDREEVTAAENLIRDHGLQSFCLALFNASEFFFVF